MLKRGLKDDEQEPEKKGKKERGWGERGRTNTWKGKRTNSEGDGFPSGYPLAKLAGVLVHDGCTRQGCCQKYVCLWLLLLAHVQASNTDFLPFIFFLFRQK